MRHRHLRGRYSVERSLCAISSLSAAQPMVEIGLIAPLDEPRAHSHCVDIVKRNLDLLVQGQAVNLRSEADLIGHVGARKRPSEWVSVRKS